MAILETVLTLVTSALDLATQLSGFGSVGS